LTAPNRRNGQNSLYFPSQQGIWRIHRIPEIDTWRAANLMLKRYGDKAREKSRTRADELAAGGDHEGDRTPAGARCRSSIIFHSPYRDLSATCSDGTADYGQQILQEFAVRRSLLEE